LQAISAREAPYSVEVGAQQAEWLDLFRLVLSRLAAEQESRYALNRFREHKHLVLRLRDNTKGSDMTSSMLSARLPRVVTAATPLCLGLNAADTTALVAAPDRILHLSAAEQADASASDRVL